MARFARPGDSAEYRGIGDAQTARVLAAEKESGAVLAAFEIRESAVMHVGDPREGPDVFGILSYRRQKQFDFLGLPFNLLCMFHGFGMKQFDALRQCFMPIREPFNTLFKAHATLLPLCLP